VQGGIVSARIVYLIFFTVAFFVDQLRFRAVVL
jgi:hypothetical protein